MRPGRDALRRPRDGGALRLAGATIAFVVFVLGCADSTRPTVGAPASSPVPIAPTTSATAARSTTARPTTGAPVPASTAVGPTTTVTSSGATAAAVAAATGPSTWSGPAVIAGLASLAAPGVDVYVDSLDGAALVRRVDEPAQGPVVGVIEPDGRTSVAPRTALATTRSLNAIRFGDRVLVTAQPVNDPPVVLLHAFGTDRWDTVAVAAPAGAYAAVTAMGSTALLTFSGPNDAVGGERWAGYVVADDGAVSPVPTPPEATAWPGGGAISVWTGRELVVAARDSSGDDRPLARPYAFDPRTLVWRALALPPWLTCGTTCAWYGPHEGGDAFLLTMAAGRVVLHGFVGSINTSELFTAAYDPATDTWQRFDQPPIPLELAAALDVSSGAKHALVAVPTSAFRNDHPDTVARLDLTTGTWTTEKIAVHVVGRGASDPGLAEVRHGSGTLLVAVYGLGEPIPERPEVVLDGGSWRVATDADSLLWRRLTTTQTTLARLFA